MSCQKMKIPPYGQLKVEGGITTLGVESVFLSLLECSHSQGANAVLQIEDVIPIRSLLGGAAEFALILGQTATGC